MDPRATKIAKACKHTPFFKYVINFERTLYIFGTRCNGVTHGQLDVRLVYSIHVYPPSNDIMCHVT